MRQYLQMHYPCFSACGGSTLSAATCSSLITSPAFLPCPPSRPVQFLSLPAASCPCMCCCRCFRSVAAAHASIAPGPDFDATAAPAGASGLVPLLLLLLLLLFLLVFFSPSCCFCTCLQHMAQSVSPSPGCDLGALVLEARVLPLLLLLVLPRTAFAAHFNAAELSPALWPAPIGCNVNSQLGGAQGDASAVVFMHMCSWVRGGGSANMSVNICWCCCCCSPWCYVWSCTAPAAMTLLLNLLLRLCHSCNLWPAAAYTKP